MPFRKYNEKGELVQTVASAFTGFNVDGDTGSYSVGDGDTLAIVGTNGIATSISGSTLSVSGAGVGFDIAGDSGTPQTVSHGETANIIGGAGISTVAGATRNLIINNSYDYESVLGSSGAFDVDLTTVTTWDSNVKTIIIHFGLRGTVSAVTDNVLLLFNNDTTVGNYYRQLHGVVAGVTALANDANPIITRCPAATSPASSFVLGTITIQAPNSTSYLKTAKVEDVMRYDGLNMIINNGGMIWNTGGTAIINSIQIRTDNHPPDLFVTGSYIRLQFIK